MAHEVGQFRDLGARSELSILGVHAEADIQVCVPDVVRNAALT